MIGVFDSGYGGLTVLQHFLKDLSQYDYMYLGDNARAPYGNHGRETLREFSEQAVEYLFAQGCTLIIIACNTVSANVLRDLQEKYLRQPKRTDRKILGVIKPLVEKAVEVTKDKRIGVVGTRGTIASKAYEIELQHLDPEMQVCSQACPLLVPLIEEHWHKKPETRMILKKYLHYLKSCTIDTLILACTHYPFLLKDFRRMMGKNVQVLNPGEIVSEKLKNYLQRHPEIEKTLQKEGKRIFLTTDDTEKFREMGSEFLGFTLKNVEKVHLG